MHGPTPIYYSFARNEGNAGEYFAAYALFLPEADSRTSHSPPAPSHRPDAL
ncbi:MAG TPA: hypothetical protein P5191_07075 [Ruminococcus sp.]|nr:hypothetical protein [Ruminococcus sp.]